VSAHCRAGQGLDPRRLPITGHRRPRRTWPLGDPTLEGGNIGGAQGGSGTLLPHVEGDIVCKEVPATVVEVSVGGVRDDAGSNIAHFCKGLATEVREAVDSRLLVRLVVRCSLRDEPVAARGTSPGAAMSPGASAPALDAAPQAAGVTLEVGAGQPATAALDGTRRP
jgi:hypothetical protein